MASYRVRLLAIRALASAAEALAAGVNVERIRREDAERLEKVGSQHESITLALEKAKAMEARLHKLSTSTTTTK